MVGKPRRDGELDKALAEKNYYTAFLYNLRDDAFVYNLFFFALCIVRTLLQLCTVLETRC